MEEHLLKFSAIEATISLDERTEGTTPDGTPWIEVPVRGFYVGNHRGQEYGERELDSMVENFETPTSDEAWSVPVQLDHSKSSRDTIGNARRVWRDGSDLKSRFRIYGAKEVQNVKTGVWRRVSISVYKLTDDDGAITYKIREFSITPFPELEGATIYEKETDMDKKATVSPSTEQFSSDHPVLVQMRSEWEAQRKLEREDFERKLQERDKRIEQSEKVIKFQKLTKRIETYGKSGKSIPVMDKAELALLESFSDEQLELYDALKEVSPKYVDFATIGDQESEAPLTTEEFTAEQAVEAGRKFIEEFGSKGAK